MSELRPIRLDRLLMRMFHEYRNEGKIFDLPKDRFFRGNPVLDTSAVFQGRRASTPLGPAAGPHGQMAQNIVLCWLAGARIIELKTIQILDELKIPRPCIDIHNVGYNVEWSQELKLEASLREYVAAAMMIEILKASGLLTGIADYGLRIADFQPAIRNSQSAIRNGETILDMSVGYSLEGISSPGVRRWIESMKDARAVIDELRGCLTGPLAPYRDLDFPATVSDSISLSTFHGCRADEIERICRFLLTELGVHVCVKMNPTLLGRPAVEHLLHDVLGYDEIRLRQEAFDNDLKFDEALDILSRLDAVARGCGRRLAVKFSNTLVVENHGSFFTDPVMYLSGQPLHVITLNLVREFRQRAGGAIPISFSAGVDALNFADMVALDFVPVTTCTDLLRAGGYGRLPRYMARLEARMQEVGAVTRAEFLLRHKGAGEQAIRRVVGELREPLAREWGRLSAAQAAAAEQWLSAAHAALLGWWNRGWGRPSSLPADTGKDACAILNDVFAGMEREFALRVWPAVPPRLGSFWRDRIERLESLLAAQAGLLNTAPIVEQATADPRYRAAENRAAPRKIGSRLRLFDCINCDKCIPVCPNDANFVYETEPVEAAYSDYRVEGGGLLEMAGGRFKVEKAHQIANYADLCNDCGNCDVYCPEDGGPQVEKPRFFGSLGSYRAAGRQGFFLECAGERRTIYGTLEGRPYRLAVDGDVARFDDGVVEAELRCSDNQVLRWQAKPGVAAEGHVIRLLPFLQLKTLLEAVSDTRRINYVNVKEP
jgi:putative selenate reductase